MHLDVTQDVYSHVEEVLSPPNILTKFVDTLYTKASHLLMAQQKIRGCDFLENNFFQFRLECVILGFVSGILSLLQHADFRLFSCAVRAFRLIHAIITMRRYYFLKYKSGRCVITLLPVKFGRMQHVAPNRQKISRQ